MLELIVIIALIYYGKRWLTRKVYEFCAAIVDEAEKVKREKERGEDSQ